MQEIKRIRKEMNIPQREIAVYLNVNLRTYQRWEDTTCKRKREILNFLKDYEFNDRFLGLGVSRLSKLLGMNTGNLSVYMRSGREIKGLNEALEKRKNELIELQYQCMLLMCNC